MTHDPHDLTGAYALGALDDTETRRFERHMDGCTSCADEVRSFRETTARLALATARPAPVALHDHVFAEIAHTRQLPPRQQTRLPSFRVNSVAWALAAACLVVALALGVVAQRSADRADRIAAQSREITAVLTAPDAQMAPQETGPKGTMTVIASRSLNKAVVTTSHLAAVPAGKTYQLWFMGGGQPRSVTTMSPTARTESTSTIAPGLDGAQQVGVTIEPAGGSPQPTTNAILTFALT
ncbi:anti-sigma factor [Actinomadura barringtoniae]|uniref:Regulator of SigK n=1 Tax=Actinomadura barringtoniae TaxID=1427535 RepID=A0A939PDN8_9ACTN|nr:anti-sigma factor [Actinomadura barringtoniae]MBO2450927.1 anti-sigma factor [Actinomadura barringtoniae]